MVWGGVEWGGVLWLGRMGWDEVFDSKRLRYWSCSYMSVYLYENMFNWTDEMRNSSVQLPS